MTVAHGYSWITAAKLATKYEIPLHLIVHDDWLSLCNLPEAQRPWLARIFGSVYRQATSRFCVSQSMAEYYNERYGVEGSVLFPCRAKDSPVFKSPPRKANGSGALTCAFAGTVDGSYVTPLIAVARNLARLRGKLLIFSAFDRHDAECTGLALPNVELRGSFASSDLIRTMRNEADVLFVPMTFMRAHDTEVRISFPSKLTDYTATGLPLLIYGPEHCSAVRWAVNNPGLGEVVTHQDDDALLAALARLCDANYRWHAGIAALDTGERYFSAERAWQTFCDGLLRSTPEAALSANLR
jgi:hypothetical protein